MVMVPKDLPGHACVPPPPQMVLFKSRLCKLVHILVAWLPQGVLASREISSASR